jgi:hypothetical protein
MVSTPSILDTDTQMGDVCMSFRQSTLMHLTHGGLMLDPLSRLYCYRLTTCELDIRHTGG